MWSELRVALVCVSKAQPIPKKHLRERPLMGFGIQALIKNGLLDEPFEWPLPLASYMGRSKRSSTRKCVGLMSGVSSSVGWLTRTVGKQKSFLWMSQASAFGSNFQPWRIENWFMSWKNEVHHCRLWLTICSSGRVSELYGRLCYIGDLIEFVIPTLYLRIK